MCAKDIGKDKVVTEKERIFYGGESCGFTILEDLQSLMMWSVIYFYIKLIPNLTEGYREKLHDC